MQVTNPIFRGADFSFAEGALEYDWPPRRAHPAIHDPERARLIEVVEVAMLSLSNWEWSGPGPVSYEEE